MVNSNSIADGVPMNLEQMRKYLQEHHGIPMALRKQGTATIMCPHCGEKHEHGSEAGHYGAGCTSECGGIVLGERFFVPNYGYTIFECKDEKKV